MLHDPTMVTTSNTTILELADRLHRMADQQAECARYIRSLRSDDAAPARTSPAGVPPTNGSLPPERGMPTTVAPPTTVTAAPTPAGLPAAAPPAPPAPPPAPPAPVQPAAPVAAAPPAPPAPVQPAAPVAAAPPATAPIPVVATSPVGADTSPIPERQPVDPQVTPGPDQVNGEVVAVPVVRHVAPISSTPTAHPGRPGRGGRGKVRKDTERDYDYFAELQHTLDTVRQTSVAAVAADDVAAAGRSA